MFVGASLFVSGHAEAQAQVSEGAPGAAVAVSESYVLADVRGRSLPESQDNYVERDPNAFRGFPAISRNGHRVVVLRTYTYAGNAEPNYTLEGLVAEYYDAHSGSLLSKFRVIDLPHENRGPIDVNRVQRRVRELNRRLVRYRPLLHLDDAEERDGVVQTTDLDPPRRWRLSGALDDAHAVPNRSREYWEYGCHPGVDTTVHVYGGGEGQPAVMVFEGVGLGCFCALWWEPVIRVVPPRRG